ncbi:MAG: hypothetical protein JST00_19010 [Deltaproteobacteria bacterium]|nr:hypothetical protein [Deltaproteobacteria bacterium]
MSRLASPLLLLLVVACGDATAPPATPTSALPPRAEARPPTFANEDGAWGRFHSKRFQVSISLPDGKSWRIDDHSRPALAAVHEASSSKVSIQIEQQEELVNRHKCEERARETGWVPSKTLTTVDQEVTALPEAYDSKIWVAIDAARPGGALSGHVYLFGAFLRRCLFVHLETRVPSANDEDILSDRLAVARARMFRGLSLDPIRTTDDATVPRDKPEIRR